MLFPEHNYFPTEIIKGFKTFCLEYAFEYTVLETCSLNAITVGDVYITLTEQELVQVLDQINQLELKVGLDIGLISYNETPLKKFILNGITTITTHFETMGKTAAELVLNHSPKHIENPFEIILRGSL